MFKANKDNCEQHCPNIPSLILSISGDYLALLGK